MMERKPKKRDPMAKTLRDPRYKKRIVTSKKIYSRKGRQVDRPFAFAA